MQFLNNEYWNKFRGCVLGPPHTNKAFLCNCLFKAADYKHVGERTCTLYNVYYTMGERVQEKEQPSLLLPLQDIFTWKGFEECVREETAHLVTLKSKSI